jgi:hypothetical protein
MTELKSSVRIRSIFLILLGAAWTVVSGAFIFLTMETLYTRPPDGTFDWFFLLLFLPPAVGLVMIAIGIYPWIAWLRVSRPEITIDKTALAVGESFTVGYLQNFKRRSDVRGIQLALAMRERATYRSGKNRVTVQHEEIIAQFDHPGQTYETDDELKFSQTIDIPKTGMHTFLALHNSIDWELRVKVDIAGWPDYRDAFAIQVLPKPGGGGL